MMGVHRDVQGAGNQRKDLLSLRQRELANAFLFLAIALNPEFSVWVEHDFNDRLIP